MVRGTGFLLRSRALVELLLGRGPEHALYPTSQLTDHRASGGLLYVRPIIAKSRWRVGCLPFSFARPWAICLHPPTQQASCVC